VSAAAGASTVGISQPSSDASSSLTSSTCSAAATSAVSSSVSQLSLCASSTLSASSMPAPSTLPSSLDSFMAALGNAESIAIIANQLVPLLARMDMGMLMQMLQVANPALAAALSAYYLQSAVTDVQQLSAAFAQLLTATNAVDASGVVQNPAETACVSSSSNSVEMTQVLDADHAIRCSSTASCDSFQSSIYSSESSQVDTNASVQMDPLPPKPCYKSPEERNIFDAIDTYRPSSTTSSTVTDGQLDTPAAVSVSGAVVFSCHLCAFRSSHRTRFAEHLSSEFCDTNSLTIAARTYDAEPTRRKRCSHCTFSTYLAEEFDQHVQIHVSSSTFYSCTYCDHTGSGVGSLRLHFKRCHPKKSFSFDECVIRQKSRAGCYSGDHSDTPQPQAVDLDPVVKLCKIDQYAVDL